MAEEKRGEAAGLTSPTGKRSSTVNNYLKQAEVEQLVKHSVWLQVKHTVSGNTGARSFSNCTFMGVVQQAFRKNMPAFFYLTLWQVISKLRMTVILGSSEKDVIKQSHHKVHLVYPVLKVFLMVRLAFLGEDFKEFLFILAEVEVN